MARLVPPVYINNNSSGEEKLFRALEKDEYSKDWIVLHSFDIPRHESQGEGEIDFVALIPHCGVMCVEVKSSSKISRKGGVWRFGSGGYRSAKGPFKQAKEAAFSLMRRVKGENPQMREVPFFPLVAFTGCNFRRLKIGGAKEWDDIDFIDAEDISSGGAARVIRRAFALQAARHKLALGAFDEKKVSEMLAILRPDFETMLTPRERALDFEARARKYTDEQFKILDSVLLNDRIAVDGLAGTGKTVLAIEYARRMSQTREVLFVTPMRRLGDHLERECRLEFPKHFAGSAEKFMENLAVLKAAHPNGFGYLVLDEAQDFVGREIFLEFDALLSGGILNGKWIMFGDYRSAAFTPESAERVRLFREKFRPALCYLNGNCRNPESVARLVERVYSGVKYGGYPDSGGDSDSGLLTRVYSSNEEQGGGIASVLEGWLKEKIPESSIAVLSMRRDFAGLSGLLKNGFWRQKLSKQQEAGKIIYSHVDDFKGLERDFVVLSDVEEVESQNSKRLFYLGATRAKISLAVFSKVPL
ncbi:MAG: NERD domain-containing protein [Opitutales bacterium]|nr:NERD domain-containing protein [Opitutales bacterium]